MQGGCALLLLVTAGNSESLGAGDEHSVRLRFIAAGDTGGIRSPSEVGMCAQVFGLPLGRAKRPKM